MKIRWQKVSPGIYKTDTGRFRVEKDSDDGRWYVYDSNAYPSPILWADSYREARQLVDDQIDSEVSTNV